jgi:hypothetical protein
VLTSKIAHLAAMPKILHKKKSKNEGCGAIAKLVIITTIMVLCGHTSFLAPQDGTVDEAQGVEADNVEDGLTGAATP